MNKILNLLDEQFVIKFLQDNLPSDYLDFTLLKNLKISTYKKYIWNNDHYHTVIKFELFLKNQTTKTIVCSAHSNEPRKNVYSNLKLLQKYDLNTPKPLFYSQEFNGCFYESLIGNHLYYYIKNNNQETVTQLTINTAKWLTKLHSIDTTSIKLTHNNNSRIKTVVPGVSNILKQIKNEYPSYLNDFEKIYTQLINNEENYLKTNPELSLVHGDAHPENIIHTDKNKIGVIDFTDLSIADPARDIGTFSQQIKFMIDQKIGDKDFNKNIKKLFLDTYFKHAKIKLNKETQNRINTYYNWTKTRTIFYYLTCSRLARDEHFLSKADKMLKELKNKIF